MIGAIIGDIAGSRFEWDNHRSKDFELFTPKCFVTDDSIMSLAVAEALMRARPDFSDLSAQAVRCMQEVGRPYPDCGYGGRFLGWMYADDPQPYHSFGNGAAMRVSACGLAAKSVEEAKALSRAVTIITHDHPEGLKGAEATAVAVYMGKSGAPMADIRACMEGYYALDFTLDSIRATYRFNETCQQTVPQALEAFFESTGFEDAIRNAISIGGDSDTVAAITGGVAGAYYGVPEALSRAARGYLDARLLDILERFEAWER